MRFIAQFDLNSDVSTNDIDQKYLENSAKDYVFRIRNEDVDIKEGISTIRCNLDFYAESLEIAKDVFMRHVREIIDVLALVTNASISFYRIYKLFDISSNSSTNEGIVFVYDPPAGEPEAVLHGDSFDVANLFLKSNLPEKISSALSWFRRGLSANSPEDQFQHFWFALELIAISEKKHQKVNDKCPVCQTSLYCETCDTHPMHAPYPKQLIQQLCEQFFKDGGNFFLLADKVRNMMMHGSFKEKIEKKVGCSLPEIIDPLGRLVWNALIRICVNTLPDKDKPQSLPLGYASTYVKWQLTAHAHIMAAIPNGIDGKPDIELLNGINVGFVDNN